ncbi:recombinase family protein [Desulfobacula sp.]|uniref:recombinase family protein n=1 Tax=Desulfobacula sp. TaxID=2593537 RepID=UPI00262CE4AE|nr:recombinase family protein [Desulfobacula sp.]
MPAAYSYIRFSSEKQSQGDSERSQIEAAHKYARKHDLTLDDSTYKDMGVSASHGTNKTEGNLKKFIQAVERGKIKKGSYLLLESIDRLSREDFSAVLTLLTQIVNLGVKVVTLIDNYEFTAEIVKNPSSMMYSVMKMSREHEESTTPSKRIKAVWEKKRQVTKEEKAKFTTICPSWIYWDEKIKKFKLIPKRAEVMELIFKMSLKGYGLKRIIDHLNLKRIPFWGKAVRKDLKLIEVRKFQGKPITKEEKKALQDAYDNSAWSNATTQRLLNYKATYGAHETPTLPLVENYFPAIVSKADFLKVREMKKKKRVIDGRAATKLHNIFTPSRRKQLPVCSICGGTMGFVDKGGGHKYLVCLTARSKKVQKKLGTTCQYHSWNYDKVERHILFSLKEMDWSLLAPGDDRDYDGEILDKKDMVGSIEKKIDNLMALVSDGDYIEGSFPSLREKLFNLERQKKAVSEEIINLEDEKMLAAHKQTSGIDIGMVDDFYQQKDDYEIRVQLNQMIKSLISKIEFNPMHLREDYGTDRNNQIWGDKPIWGWISIRFHPTQGYTDEDLKQMDDAGHIDLEEMTLEEIEKYKEFVGVRDIMILDKQLNESVSYTSAGPHHQFERETHIKLTKTGQKITTNRNVVKRRMPLYPPLVDSEDILNYSDDEGAYLVKWVDKSGVEKSEYRDLPHAALMPEEEWGKLKEEWECYSDAVEFIECLREKTTPEDIISELTYEVFMKLYPDYF